MSIKTNTFTQYDAKGNRENLTEEISNISPTETPFFSMVGRVKADAVLHEWQTDALAAVDTANKQLEGDDIDSGTYSAATATVRLGNYVQISYKTGLVSATQDAVNKAGRKKEKAYQIVKRGKELKRDMEAIALANQGAAAGDTSTARATGSVLAFIKTNVDKHSGGSNPSYTTVPTGTRSDGTQRAFTETILKNVAQQIWTSGGDLGVLMVGAFNKQAASAFAGIAGQRFNAQGAKPSTIIGAADIYVSDFGNLSVVPNRFMRTRDALFIDPAYAKIMFLRPIQAIDLAKTGDADKFVVITEWGVKVLNEKAHGIAADLTTS